MTNIAEFLARQKRVQEENEQRTQAVFDEFLAGLTSSKDLVEVWGHHFNQDQTNKLIQLFHHFLEAESSVVKSAAELSDLWRPILNLPSLHKPFFLMPVLDIYRKHQERLEHQ